MLVLMTTLTLPEFITLPLLSSLGASPEEWAAIPAHIRRNIERLWDEHQRMQERLGLTSQNSSLPPSADPPSAPPRPTKPPSARAPGGQPGHPDTQRPLVPTDQVTEVIAVRPAVCAHCAQPLPPTLADPAPQRHQVWDIPPLTATVTEYQRHTLTCPHCGQRTPTALPPGVPQGGYSARVTALVALLTGQYHLAKRAVADLLTTTSGLPISAASVSGLETTMSAGLQAPYDAARATVPSAPLKWVDETGWRQQREPDPDTPLPRGPLPKAWLWTAVTEAVTVFAIRRSRAAKVATELLSATPAGIIHTDRHSAYRWLPLHQHQLCWAHLRRDFQKLIDRGGSATPIGTALRDASDTLFTLWHRIRDGTLAWEAFPAAMAPVQAAVRAALQEGATTADKRTRTFCRILQRLDPALWTFVHVPGAEPTNNRAERAIRPGVLWRTVSFGTQTSAGSRFVERVMTAVATCRQHERNVLTYLTAVATAGYARTSAPSLL